MRSRENILTDPFGDGDGDESSRCFFNYLAVFEATDKVAADIYCSLDVDLLRCHAALT